MSGLGSEAVVSATTPTRVLGRRAASPATCKRVALPHYVRVAVNSGVKVNLVGSNKNWTVDRTKFLTSEVSEVIEHVVENWARLDQWIGFFLTRCTAPKMAPR